MCFSGKKGTSERRLCVSFSSSLFFHILREKEMNGSSPEGGERKKVERGAPFDGRGEADLIFGESQQCISR